MTAARAHFMRCRWLAGVAMLSAVSASGRPEATKENSQAFSARLVDAQGDVRVLRRLSVFWEGVAIGSSLRPGEKIFVGEGASARIEYFRRGATLKLRENSLLRVAMNPPALSRFRRQFGTDIGRGESAKKGNTQKGKAERGGAVRSIIARPDEESLDFGANEEREVDTAGMSLTRDVEPLPLLFPSGNVLLLARRFPAFLSIQVDPAHAQRALWAYVWSDASATNPVQSVFSKGDFARVPLRAAGKYTVQVVSEDETFASRAVKVEVVSGTEQDLFGRIKAGGIVAGQAVILQ